MRSFLLSVMLSIACVASVKAEPISYLKIRPSEATNLKRVSMEATLKEDVFGNGFCFITTGSFRESLGNIIPEGYLSKLRDLRERIGVRKFEKYDAYCGLTMGSKVKSNGLLAGRVSKSIRARIYITTFENKEPIKVFRDAAACSFVRLARSCFKTVPADVKTIENNDGTVSVSGAVTGLAACFEFYERRGELNKSVVVTIGNVSGEMAAGANSKAGNASHEDKTCHERGFRV